MVLSMCIPLHLDGVAQTNIMECLSVIMSGQTDLWRTVTGMSVVVELFYIYTYSRSVVILTIY